MNALTLFAAAVLGLAIPALGQGAPTHAGEFTVNEYTSGDQNYANVAADRDGNFIVVWHGVGADDADGGVYARRFNADGSPHGSQFRVNTTTAGDELTPAVAMNGSGQFVVVWQGPGTNGQAKRVYAQRFTSDGSPSGSEFRADTGADDKDQSYPTVGIDGNGNFVVGYTTDIFFPPAGYHGDVHVQFYNAAGTQIGTQVDIAVGNDIQQFPVIGMAPSGDFVVSYRTLTQNLLPGGVMARRYFVASNSFSGEIVVDNGGGSYDPGHESLLPSVAMRDDGSFVVVWQHTGIDGSGYGIAARRYLPDATPAGLRWVVNTTTAGDQDYAAVTYDSRDRFTVVWRTKAPGAADPNDFDVYGQRFKSDGSRDGSQFQVNTNSAGLQSTWINPCVIADPAGNIVVAWETGSGTNRDIAADKLIFPSPAQDEFRVNTYTLGNQWKPAVGMAPGGHFVVVWQSDGQDGDGAGVYGQVYNQAANRVGNEFRINSYTTGNQGVPNVAMNSAGTIVVGWHGTQNPSLGDSAGEGVGARRFHFDGTTTPTAVGPEFLANSGVGYTAADQEMSGIAITEGGYYAIGWNSSDGSTFQRAFVRYYDPNGSEIATTLIGGGDGYSNPVLRTTTGGDYVLTYVKSNGYPDSDVWVALVDKNGNTLKGPYLAHSPSSALQGGSSATLLTDGSLVTVWEVQVTPGDASSTELHGQRLDPASGTLIGNEFVVNTFSSGEQAAPTVAASVAGTFYVIYRSNGLDGSGFATGLQKFNTISSTPAKDGMEMVANVFTSGLQAPVEPATLGHGRALASDAFGNYVAVWHSDTQDGSQRGVYATKVFVSTPPSVTTTAATNLTASTATLNGSVTPNDVAITVSFEVAGSSSDLGTAGATILPATPPSFSPGVYTPQSVTRDVTGLTLGIGNSPKTYYYRTVATPAGSSASIFGPVVSFTVQNSVPVARDDTFIVAGESTLDPIKQTLSAGTPGQDTDADPGDTLTIKGTPTGASLGTATTTLDHLTISYNPGDLFPGSAGGDTFSYSIQDTHGGEATAMIHVYSVRSLAGNYVGLIGADGTGAAAGRLDITLTRMGQITGSFKWQGQLYTFNQATLGTDGTFVKALPKDRTNPNAGTLQLSLRLDALTKILTGTLTDTSTDPATVVTAEVTGTASADDLDLQDLPGPGIYSAYIDPGTVSSAAAEIPAQITGLVLPRGLGFSQIVVGGKSTSRSRPARTAGRMPDDQPFTSGAKGLTRALRAASGQAKYSLYVDNLYAKVRDTSNRPRSGGVVSGDLFFTRNTSRFDSSLNWERLANPNAPRFQGGIKGLTAVLNALKYGRPPAGTLPGGIRGDHNPNAKLTLTEGDLVATLTQAAQLTRLGSGGVRSAAFGANSQGFKLSVSATGGSFKGSFVHPVSNELVKFNGVFKDQDGQGVFTGPTTTGRIQILAQ